MRVRFTLLLSFLLATPAGAELDVGQRVRAVRLELQGMERGIRLLDQALEGSQQVDQSRRQRVALEEAELDLLLERPALAAESLEVLTGAGGPSVAGERLRVILHLAEARTALGDPFGAQQAAERLLDEPVGPEVDAAFPAAFRLWLAAAATSGRLAGLERWSDRHRELLARRPVDPYGASSEVAALPLALAQVRLWRGDWPGALAALGMLPPRYGDLARARYFAGAALAALGRLEDAEAAFRESAHLYRTERRDPERAARAQLQRARLLADLGRFSLATECYQALVADPVVGSTAVRELGLVRLREGRPDLARVELAEALPDLASATVPADLQLLFGEILLADGAEVEADRAFLVVAEQEGRRRDALQGFLARPDAVQQAAAFFRSRGSCPVADALAPPPEALRALEQSEQPARVVAALDRTRAMARELGDLEALTDRLQHRDPGRVREEVFPLLATGRRYGRYLRGEMRRLTIKIDGLRSEIERRGPGVCPVALAPAPRLAGPAGNLSVSPCVQAARELQRQAAGLAAAIDERNARLDQALATRQRELDADLAQEQAELQRLEAELARVRAEGEALYRGAVGAALAGALARAAHLTWKGIIAHRDRPWNSRLRIERLIEQARNDAQRELQQVADEHRAAER